MGWPGWHVPPLVLWNFHQPVKELKSTGKIFIKCPYDFASEVRYTVNMNWLKKCATPVILPQIRLWSSLLSCPSYTLQALLYWEPFPTKTPDSCWKWGKENGARGPALCWIFNTSPWTGDNYLLMDCTPSCSCLARSGFSGRIILFPCNCLAPVFLISISIFNIPH